MYIKKRETLCNNLNWGNWNSGFGKLGVRWAERDNENENPNKNEEVLIEWKQLCAK